MSITIKHNTITVDGEDCVLEDLYNSTSNMWARVVDKIDKSYIIRVNLKLINNSTLTMKGETLIYTGTKLVIEKGSTLQLGSYDAEKQLCYDNCMLMAYNLDLEYGFGNSETDNSGNLLCYGSVIDAWSFWSFSEGENLVKIIDSQITGFGLISGIDSVMSNVTFMKSHGRYGILSVKKNIAVYDDIRVKNIVVDNDVRSIVYYNPSNNTNMLLTKLKANDYTHMVYIEPYETDTAVTLLDCELTDNYDVYRSDEYVDVFVNYTFMPKIIDITGSPISDTNIKITDSCGRLVVDTNTDENGYITVVVNAVTNTASGDIINHNPFKVTINNDKTLTIFITKKLDNLILSYDKSDDVSAIDYDRIEDIVNKAISNETDFRIMV